MYETLENQKLVYAKYAEAFEKQKSVEKILTVKGNQSAEKIADEIGQGVEGLM
jgi:thymidylate kinase